MQINSLNLYKFGIGGDDDNFVLLNITFECCSLVMKIYIIR